jgi:hypothetical protein
MSPGGGALAGRPELVVFGLIGLLGGAHCLGMCGPLVTAYADRLSDDRGVTWGELRQHALFNAGRTASYATIGALLGALGGLAFEVAALAAVGDAVRATTGLVVGLAILAVGASYLLRGRATGLLHDLPVVGRAFGRLSRALGARVDDLAGGPGIVALGAVHGLLPCPLLYPAFLYALSTGSPVEGGAALLALGLGTFPTLFAYGAALGTLGTATRVRLHRALGATFVLLATVPLAHALGLLGVPVPHVPLPHPTP